MSRQSSSSTVSQRGHHHRHHPHKYSDVKRTLRATTAYSAGAGGGGGGDPDPGDGDGDDGDQQTAPPAYSRRGNNSRTVHRLFGGGMDTYPWASQFVVAAQAEVGSWSIWGLLAIAIGVLIPWALEWIYTLPQAVMRYGAIQYVPLGVLYILNLVLVKNIKINEFYQLVLFLNVLALADTVWLAVVFGYNFYACHVGVYPVECKDNYPIDILMTVPTVVLLFVQLVLVFKLFFIVVRTSGTQPVTYIRLSNY